MKTIILLFALLFGMLIGIIILRNPNYKFSLNLKSPKVTIENQTFNVTVAKTSKEKEIGLSEKKSISQNEGMIFLFDTTDYYSFWMKDMKFPIDIIFISDGKIVNIYENVQPPKSTSDNLPVYQSKSPINTVLEINAGLSSKYGFKEGQSLKYENIQ